MLIAVAVLAAARLNFAKENSQDDNVLGGHFIVGERLTYNIAFGKLKHAAYAETHVVSRGKLGEKDAIELHSKIKTNDFVSAAFYLVDEWRTTFVSAETGFPLFVRKTSNISGLPSVTTENYLASPTANYDLLALIYQARNMGGSGTFSLFEDGKNYTVSLLLSGNERVATDAGDFETSVSSVTSEFLSENGIRDLKVNFSIDAARIPVLIRFKTDKGDFRAEIASIQNTESKITNEPAPTPSFTPTPQPTPKPISTPSPYIDNRPLVEDIAFRLGETLEYRVTANGILIGFVTLRAKERTLFSGQDSLRLTATVTGVEKGVDLLSLNEGITAQVNPESLAPQLIELNFTGPLSQFNQTARFDQKAGTVTVDGSASADAPVGTHSLLSLAYAIRSFNLRPSPDPSNPVNDTRVAVFFDDRATVVTIRPSIAELLAFDGARITAQMVSISTGNPNFDRFNLKIWLSTDENRLPMKLAGGIYQAELIKRSNSLNK